MLMPMMWEQQNSLLVEALGMYFNRKLGIRHVHGFLQMFIIVQHLLTAPPIAQLYK
ncbi:hypothetical protein D3C78_813650 [compost metagenome]